MQTLIAIFVFQPNIHHLVIQDPILRIYCRILQKVVKVHSLCGGSSTVFMISSIVQKYERRIGNGKQKCISSFLPRIGTTKSPQGPLLRNLGHILCLFLNVPGWTTEPFFVFVKEM